MTQELCNGIIVLEAAAMLHDTDVEFAIIDSAHEAKSTRKCFYGTRGMTRQNLRSQAIEN